MNPLDVFLIAFITSENQKRWMKITIQNMENITNQKKYLTAAQNKIACQITENPFTVQQQLHLIAFRLLMAAPYPGHARKKQKYLKKL